MTETHYQDRVNDCLVIEEREIRFPETSSLPYSHEHLEQGDVQPGREHGGLETPYCLLLGGDTTLLCASILFSALRDKLESQVSEGWTDSQVDGLGTPS